MKVTVISFSFKRGIPDDPTGNGNAPVAEGDQVGRMSEAKEPRSGRKRPRGFVFDCRAMPNPFWDESLRGYTGRDKPVVDFFARFPETVEPFLEATETLVRQSIEQYKRDGRDHLQVAFGCTGGQHRSVYFAERMAERLAGIDGVEIEVSHTAKQYWTTNHAKENRDIIFQEELR